MELVELKQSQLEMVPVTGAAELFGGSLVEWSGEGVDLLDIASGALDTTGETIIAGLVIGTNNETKVYEDGTTVAGFAGEEITGLVTQAGLVGRTQFGNRGMYPKGEKLAMVEIAIIDCTTRIRAPIYNAAFGTAPTLLTVTAGSTDGLGCTTNAADAAGVADLSTLYFRSGVNAGAYRVTDDASSTVHTNDHPFTRDISIGDTGVKVNLKHGFCRVQFDAAGLYINCGAALTADYYGIIVDYIDLRTAGKEFCEFRFIPKHFGTPIA